MAQYIDKDALVAEIKRLRREDGNPYYFPSETADKYYARGVHFTCDGLVNFLDTLEVKDVVLEKELTWKDIAEIEKISNLLEIEWLNSTPWDGIRDCGFYAEVLKRFKDGNRNSCIA